MMAKPTEIFDKDGGSFLIGDAGEIWFPPFPLPHSYKKQLEDIKSLTMRPDDVILSGFAKCGTTWHYEILCMLQNGSADYVHSAKPSQMLDNMSKDALESLPSPRVLNTHVLYKHMPTQALKKGIKIVLLYRNPKDSCVSMFNHMRDWTKGGYSGNWENFVDMYLDKGVWYGSYFDFMVDWDRELKANPSARVFKTSYEEMIKDPINQIFKISEFLELGRSKEFCGQVADKCSFAKLKHASATVKENPFPGVWKDGSPGFFRKGVVGDWENWLTKEQNDRFDAIIEEKLKNTSFNYIYNL